MTEALFTFGLTAAVWALPTGGLTKIAERASWIRVAAFGALLGLTALVRIPAAFSVGVFVVLLAGLLIKLLGRRAFARRIVVGGLIFSGAAALPLGVWMVRNRIVFHEEFEKPNHDDVTLLGSKTDFPEYRHGYSNQYMSFQRSYEQPFVLDKTWEPPTLARYVYPGEKEEVVEAFKQLATDIFATTNGPHVPVYQLTTKDAIVFLPIQRETLDRFQTIADKRYRAAPRLYLTAPLSRLVRFWIAPRVSVVFNDENGQTAGFKLTLGMTVYNCLYVIPGIAGLLLGLRRSRLLIVGALAVAAGVMGLYALWHCTVSSRYTVPLFPLICVGLGVVAAKISVHGLSFSVIRARDRTTA
jgi:hypothetical protein